jgi:hypothetical protein
LPKKIMERERERERERENLVGMSVKNIVSEM